MTVRELHDDPAKMAAFMGWPYEDDEIEESGRHWYGFRTKARRARTAAEATRERYDQYRLTLREVPRDTARQEWAAFVRECARETLGIVGRLATEVRRKCLAARPDLYRPAGEELLGREGE